MERTRNAAVSGTIRAADHSAQDQQGPIMPDSDTSQSDARRAGERLAAARVREDPFAAAFKATRMPMIVTDPNQQDNPIIFCNAAFQRLTGYSNDELVGKNCRLLQGPETSGDTVRRLREAVSEGKDISVDILNYKKDGSTFWNALFVSPVRDDDGDIIYFFASQLDFTNIKSKEAELAAARHQAEEAVAERTGDLQESLAARTLLVHEVDHRVKNNLATLASIVKMQVRLTEDQGQRQALLSVLNRIEAISTVQRKLFTTNDVARFDIGDFARELVTDLLEALKRDDIRLTMDVSPVFVPAVKATPLSLIVNELVGDAVRRGLADGGGEIHVVVRRLNGHFLIRVEDTSEPVEPDPASDELGRRMLEASARQVGATIEKKMEGRRNVVDVTLLIENKDTAQ